MQRTAVSLFIDDTHFLPPGALGRVMAFCAAQGVRGKLSAMPGHRVWSEADTLGKSERPAVLAYMAEIARAGARGFDVHMELMTHRNLWDFRAGVQRADGDGPHESVWLMEPEISVAEYEAYFGGILDNVSGRAVKFDGMTVPGCDCEPCRARRQALRAEWPTIGDNAWQALLNMAGRDRFGVPALAVFIGQADAARPTRVVAERDGYGVYDVRVDIFVEGPGEPGGGDADFYLTEDGRGGRIAELVLGGAEQCFLCAHWGAMNPTQPEGWAAFQEIVRRINATLGECIEWVKPSEYGVRLMAAGQLAGSGGR